MKVCKVSNGKGCGDWEGIYIDGILASEGHSLDWLEVLRLIADKKGIIDCIDEISLNDDQMEELGYSLPNSISEVIGVVNKG